MSPSLNEERELFTHPCPSVEPDMLWSALKRSPGDDGLARRRRGAEIGPVRDPRLDDELGRVHGRDGRTGRGRRRTAHGTRPPEGGEPIPFTSKWGEDIHSRKVEKDLVAGIDGALASGAG